jgi:exosome complex exonuclease DIS3/RRP44
MVITRLVFTVNYISNNQLVADVTHFVKPDTELDKEAIKRSTSVYLVDRRIDMLPKILTENLCSLKGKVDRLAFSAIFEINDNGEVIKTEFTKSIIRSRAAMTYSEAQTIIDDKSTNNKSKLWNSVKILHKISQTLRKIRISNGALTLASPQVKFGLDTETMNPTDVEMYELSEANFLVEEFMLLANIYVAKEILKNFPNNSCLRRRNLNINERSKPFQ